MEREDNGVAKFINYETTNNFPINKNLIDYSVEMFSPGNVLECRGVFCELLYF